MIRKFKEIDALDAGKVTSDKLGNLNPIGTKSLTCAADLSFIVS
jgi:hypothetical protein